MPIVVALGREREVRGECWNTKSPIVVALGREILVKSFSFSNLLADTVVVTVINEVFWSGVEKVPVKLFPNVI